MGRIKLKKQFTIDLLLICLLPVTVYLYQSSQWNFVVFDSSRADRLLTLRNITLVIYAFIFLLNVVSWKYSKLQLMLIALFIVFFIILTIQTSDSQDLSQFFLLTYLALIVLYKDFDYGKVIKIVAISFLVVSICALLLSLIKVLSINIGIQPQRIRYGLAYPGGSYNSFSIIFLYFCLYYVYTRNIHISIIEILLLLVINFLLFYLVSSRSTFLMVSFVIIISILLKFNKKFMIYSKMHSFVLLLTPLLVSVLSIVLAGFYDENLPFMQKVDSLLSGRLRLSNNAIYNFRLTFLGRQIEFITSGNMYDIIDNSYLRIMFKYGVVLFLVVIVFLIYFSVLINRNKDIYLFYIFLFSTIHCFVSLDLSTLFFDYLLFVWSYKNSIAKRYL